MLGRTNAFRGAALAFSIVGGTEQPVAPSENTIWINTGTAVTGWALSASRPSGPVNGFVWIETGAKSDIAFNALKDNAIIIMPLSARQYIGGAWVDVESQIYQNGAWKGLSNWSMWIVKDGVKNPNIEASGVGKGPDYSYELLSTVTITDGSSSLMVETTDGCGMVYFGPISLTDVNAITIDGEFNFAGYDAYYQFCAWTQIGAYTTSYREANVKMTATGATLDVSGLTGDHYIGFTTRGAATQYVTNMYMDAASPSGPEIVSWAEGTDKQIAAMVAALDAGTISIEDTGWAVGDERVVTLSAMAATGVGETHAEQSVTLVLMDSQHYTLTEATAGGDTKDHFVVGLKNCLNETGYMDSSETYSGSWSGCDRRAWCNSVFRAAIPETLRGCFKQFKVPTATRTANGSSVTETDDYFALFAEKEIIGKHDISNSTEAAALSQIEWYKTAANRIKKAGDAGSACSWYERSPYSDTFFLFISQNGGLGSYATSANTATGISPFGCI